MVQINNSDFLSTEYSQSFSKERWNGLSSIQKKQLIKNEVKALCKYKSLHISHIKFDFLEDSYGTTYLDSKNEAYIYFDANLLKDEYEDSGAILLATIHHELKHVEQMMNPNVPLEVVLGVSRSLSSTYKNNQNWACSLYIRQLSGNFELFDAIYVLQPCEIEAFCAGEAIQEETNIVSLEMTNRIKNANSIMADFFGEKNFSAEIKNSILTLYDGKPREYSEEIFDLVERCSICSYVNKEDYGVDRTLLFLNDKYKADLLEKRQEYQNNTILKEDYES